MGVRVVVGLGSLIRGAGLHRVEPRFETVSGFGHFRWYDRWCSRITHTTPHLSAPRSPSVDMRVLFARDGVFAAPELKAFEVHQTGGRTLEERCKHDVD